jgi:hypothetical protein
MRFLAGSVPRRKKKHRKNPVTDHPVFLQMLKAMTDGQARAALVFEPDEAKKLKIKNPWRVATDALRRTIKAEALPYRVNKYQTDAGGWAVQVIRKTEQRVRTEEGAEKKNVGVPRVRSA